MALLDFLSRRTRVEYVPRDLTWEEVQEALDEHMAMSYKEDAELRHQLRIDDEGWDPMGLSSDGALTTTERRTMVKMARRHGERDALSKLTIKLYTNFGVGLGLDWEIDDPSLLGHVEDFWKSPFNQKFLSSYGQRQMSNRFLIDGEQFIALFLTRDRQVRFRLIDPLEIQEVLTDPDDVDTPRFYKRVRTTRKGQEEVTYLRDINNGGPLRGEGARPGEDAMGELVTKATSGTPVVLHVMFDGWTRGNSILTPQLQWLRAHRAFMKSRTAVQQAIARNANKLKVKGGQAAVTAQKNQHQSSLVTNTAGRETNPAQASGSLWVENLAANLERMSQDTGAGSAQVDGNQLLLMVGAGAGIYPHYYGAGDAFRLATAKAMETPMRRNFESYQETWKETWRNIFNYIGDLNGVPEDNRGINVSGPEIVAEDIDTLVGAMDKALTKVPELAESRTVMSKMLDLLDIDDPDQVLDDLEKIRAEKQAKADEIAARGGIPGGDDDEEEMDSKDPEEMAPKEVARILYRAVRDASNGHAR